ncbi:hypothetical protein COCOBI_11-0740 [Coccomyxa sp. Obi]|nr:hypothetical protein COCOBI_11-0740 [Coccomyxa sp. Obi]
MGFSAGVCISCILCVLLIFSIEACEQGHVTQEATCSIGILDLTDPAFNLPSCDPADKIVANDQGQIRTRSSCPNQSCEERASHNISHFAGPHWLQHYLRKSEYYTEDIKSADAVFVYDYCYIQWMIGDMHANERKFPHRDMHQGYTALSRLDRFGKLQGRDFVFFEPHPFSGVYSHFCEEFARSLHLVVEGPQRYICPAQDDHRDFLVVPYSSPEFVDDPVIEEVERDIDIFFQGHCSSEQIALAVRKYAVDYLNSLHLPSVQVACDKSNSHKELRGMLRRSKFCLVIAGGTASTRRLTDVMLAGCIPVFLGPPWHSLPLAQWVDYPSFAVFAELAAMKTLEMETPAVALSEPPAGQTATNLYDHAWWILDADISSAVRTIGNMSELLPLLEAMPAEEIAEKHANLRKYQSYFRYRRTPAEELDPAISSPTAVDAILGAICDHVKHVAARHAVDANAASPRKHSIFSFLNWLFRRFSTA